MKKINTHWFKMIFFSWWGIGVLLLCWLFFSLPFFFQEKIPFPTDYLVSFFPPWNASYTTPVKNGAMPDVITQIYPWKFFTIDTYKQGQIPLWNPYGFSGTPHAGNYQSAVFSPINILFFLFSFPTAWSMHILFQPLLAGIFMYLFLQENKLSKISCVVSGISFGYCGFLVSWMAYGTLGYAVLFLPFILLYILRLTKQKSFWNFLGIVFGVAFSLFSGHFQMSIYVIALSAIYGLFLFGQRKNKEKITSLFILSCAFLLGVLVALPQLIITYQTYRESLRNDLVLKHEIIPWNYIITQFAPDFYGNPVTRNDWYGHYAEWASYIGILPIVFALFALLWKRKIQEIFWFTVGTVTLFLAYPTVLSDLIYLVRFPVLSTSAASRIIVIYSFSLSILSAFGLEKLIQAVKNNENVKHILLSIFVLVFLTIVLFIFFSDFTAEKRLIAQRNSVIPLSLLGISFIYFYLVFRTKLVIKSLPIFILVIIIFDMLRFATKWMPFADKSNLYPDLPVIKHLQQIVGFDRAFGNYGAELSGAFFVPSIEGYDAIYKARYGEFIGTASNGQIAKPERSVVKLNKNGKFTKEIMQLLGVKYIVHKKADGRFPWAFPYWLDLNRYKTIYQDDTYEILVDTQVFPRVFLADSYIIKYGSQEIIDTLFGENIDRKKTLVLEKKPQHFPQLGDGQVNIVSYTPNNIRLKIETSVPKLLFLSDVYSEGWRAYLGTQPLEILRANYAFRAVSIPEGEHLVTFEYNPPHFLYALSISGVIVMFFIVGSLKTLYEHRHI